MYNMSYNNSKAPSKKPKKQQDKPMPVRGQRTAKNKAKKAK